MIAIPILPDEINKADYWFLQVEGIEWAYVLSEKITKGFEDRKADERAMFMIVVDDTNIYAVKRSLVPIELIMKYTGMSKDVIEKAEVLKLTVKPRPDLPKPTVPYWGEA